MVRQHPPRPLRRGRRGDHARELPRAGQRHRRRVPQRHPCGHQHRLFDEERCHHRQHDHQQRLRAGIGVSFKAGDSAGNLANLHISNDQIFDNGTTTATDTEKSGILIEDPAAGIVIGQNYIYDSGSTKQKYGITVNTVAVTDALIEGNHLSGNTTSALNLVGGGTIAGEIVNNKGYHLGAAGVSPGASPWTYTAGNTPEVVYVIGGTVSGITKNSQTVASPVFLNPGEAMVVTYSSAQTVVVDKK